MHHMVPGDQTRKPLEVGLAGARDLMVDSPSAGQDRPVPGCTDLWSRLPERGPRGIYPRACPTPM
jgi:hypothetical protein